MIACLAATACLLASASPSAGAGRPPVALVAVPAHVVLLGRERRTVRVENGGTQQAVVDVSRAAFALDLRGRPRLGPARRATAWLAFAPRRLVIPAGTSRTLWVAARLPRGAEPGDHEAVVLLTSRPRRRGAVFVRMRLGVLVGARAPGRVVHRLAPVRLTVRRAGRTRVLELLLANRGNVTETLTGGCLRLDLRRGKRAVVGLRPTPRRYLPRTRGITQFRYRGPIRGWVRAALTARRGGECAPFAVKAFRIRL
ncbi:MAG TPA: hypothetical protein VFA66_12725 [Gaiellaceae bacterium]|nr:hypothetical protein [Gaiellaceae bacterium]